MNGSQETFEAAWPPAKSGTTTLPTKPRLEDLNGHRIGFVWDYVLRGDVMSPAVASEFARHGWGKDDIRHRIFTGTKVEAGRVERYPIHTAGGEMTLERLVADGVIDASYIESDDVADLRQQPRAGAAGVPLRQSIAPRRSEVPADQRARREADMTARNSRLQSSEGGFDVTA